MTVHEMIKVTVPGRPVTFVRRPAPQFPKTLLRAVAKAAAKNRKAKP